MAIIYLLGAIFLIGFGVVIYLDDYLDEEFKEANSFNEKQRKMRAAIRGEK